MNVIAPRVIRVELHVKFRTGPIYWGAVRRAWTIDLPKIDVVWQEAPSIHLNERGVKLDVWVE